MPSERYSFRRSTLNAGIASQMLSNERRNDPYSRRERSRARRPAISNVSTSPRVLANPPNVVMPLASDQQVSGGRLELHAAVTVVSAELAVHIPNPFAHQSTASALASREVVGDETQSKVSASVTAWSSASEEPSSTSALAVTDVGCGTKRSSRSPSPLPMEKRRKIEQSVPSGEYGSGQAESWAAAIARAMSAMESPAAPAVGSEDFDMDAELNDDMLSMNDSLPPTTPAIEMLNFSGEEAAPLEAAPASPRAMDAVETMLDLAWAQPVPTPLPTPELFSLNMTSPSLSSPSPPPFLQPTPASPVELVFAQSMLGMQSTLPQPVARPASPRALEAAESMLGLYEVPPHPFSPTPPPPPSPRAFEAAVDIMELTMAQSYPLSPRGDVSDSDDDSYDESENDEDGVDDVQAVADMLLQTEHPTTPEVTEETRAQHQEFLDVNLPASPYHAGMADRFVGAFGGCVLCTEEPEVGETMVRILNCHHAFCQPCIDEWLVEQDKNSCPICRETVITL